MKFSFEKVQYDKHLSAKILIQKKPRLRCHSRLHWHREFEIVYIIDGALDVNINGNAFTVANNELYFTNTQEIHKTQTPKSIDENYYIVILLSYDFLKTYYPELDNVVFNLNENNIAKAKITEVIRKMIPLAEEKPQYYEFTMLGYVAEIYRILLSDCITNKRSLAPSTSVPNNSYAKKAIEYIDKHYKEDITLSSISAYIGLTPTYFANAFKKITNTSFIHYLNVIRLDKALHDMLRYDFSAKKAAEENGFSNVKSMISYCKKVYGCTPSEYKKRVSDNEK